MLHVITKRILVCHTFVIVILNGVLEFAGTVKICRCNSIENGYHVIATY